MTQSFQVAQSVIEWIRLHHESVTGRVTDIQTSIKKTLHLMYWGQLETK